jgi:serine O-acetyltransferase
MNLFELIKSDIYAKAEWVYGDRSRKSVAKTLVADGTFAMVTYRLMQWSQKHRISFAAMFFNKMNVWFGGCIIGRGADFGPSFVLIHSDGVVINSSVRAGHGMKIEHQVTIGAERNESPVLGDDIFIGAGAKIIGGVTLGSRVKVGANAVVTKSLPDDVTAVGIPARII